MEKCQNGRGVNTERCNPSAESRLHIAHRMAEERPFQGPTLNSFRERPSVRRGMGIGAQRTGRTVKGEQTQPDPTEWFTLHHSGLFVALGGEARRAYAASG